MYYLPLSRSLFVSALLNGPEEEEECNDVGGQYTVIIQSPTEIPKAETDQDWDASDNEATADPNHLSRRILAAKAGLLTFKDDVTEDQNPRGAVPPPTSAAQLVRQRSRPIGHDLRNDQDRCQENGHKACAS